MARRSGVRTVCGALMAVTSVTLGISDAAADDLVRSEEFAASDAGDAADRATGGGRLLWSRQPGTRDGDFASAVASDTDGNLYVVGYTGGALAGANKGSDDAWMKKFDADGRRLWSRQPGTGENDSAAGVAIDKDGNIYVVGQTAGALGGPNKGGGTDAWVIKFDAEGRRLWGRQPGTGENDSAAGVATDTDGNVYVVGSTYGALGGAHQGDLDAWIIKFAADGHQLWIRQPATSGYDYAEGVVTDSDGNVYVVGGGTDNTLRVIKFDRDGHVLWSRQPGFGNGRAVATDTDGNVYAVGETVRPNRGDTDAWVIKFAGDGRLLWSRQPATRLEDIPLGVATDTDGNVSVVGLTSGALGGPTKGDTDAWVIKFAGNGHVLWSLQPGTRKVDWATSVATDPDGNVAVVGYTVGALGGANRGYNDAWIIKYAR